MTARRTDQSTAFFRRSLANIIASPGHATSYGLKRWGNDCPYFVEKAGVSATSSDGTFASESQAFFESVSADSVVSALPLRRVPFHARLSSVTSGASASWIAENQAKPLGRLTVSTVGLEPKKVAALIVVSDELLRDTGGESVIQSDLRRSVSDALDAAFLSSSAATDAQPAGIFAGVAVISGGVDIQGSIGALVAAFNGDLRRSAFVARPDVFASISQFYPRVGLTSGFLMNVPAIASAFAPADRLILVDA